MARNWLSIKTAIVLITIFTPWAYITSRILYGLQVRPPAEQISNLIVSATLSLSGVFLAVIGILIAIYWSGSLTGETKRAIRWFLFVVTALSVLNATSCLAAMAHFLFGFDFLLVPMLALFFSTIYFDIVCTIMLVTLSVR